MAPVTIEVCIDSLDSVAQTMPYTKGNRYECCSDLTYGGGLTPSYGLVKTLKTKFPDVQLSVMIRPRPGGFVYSEDELITMENEITALKELKPMGFVFGCLTPQGEVDEKVCRRLLDVAAPFPVTFHRAFDVTPDWKKAFKTIASLGGFKRILTSGQAVNVADGLDLIGELMELAKDTHVTILPGAGVNGENMKRIRDSLPLLTEIHTTGSRLVIPSGNATLAKGETFGFGNGEEFHMDIQGKFKPTWEACQ